MSFTTTEFETMPMNDQIRRKLTDLHKALLRVHKILLDDERRAYEKENGPIESSAQALNLVMYDPWFDWLHNISESIVKIDEIMDEEDSTFADASELISAVRALFQASGEDSPFMEKYKTVLKREPAAINAHAELQKVLAPDA